MRNNLIFKQILLVVSVVVFVSCDKDYNAIGDGLIGGNHFDLAKDNLSTVSSTWKKTGAIASNNLDVNSLGILDNSVFGQTTATFATQVQLASVNPTIDVNLGQTVESVTLYIPYYTNAAVTADPTTGRPQYALDSIYGNKSSKIKLSIYENKYLLGNLNTEEGAPLSDENYPQLYYTNQNDKIPNNPSGQLLNDSSDSKQNSAFVFSAAEYKVVTPAVGTTPESTTYTAPGMQLDLNKEFFRKLLFDKSSPGYDLSSNERFERYFKGLYFSVEKVDTEGVMNRMDFKKGTIVVKYKEKTSATVDTKVDKSITLNLTGNTVNLLKNEASTALNSYSTPMADRLYLRGGEGSVATIDLFNPAVDAVSYIKATKTIDPNKGNGVPDELDYINYKGWLINQASLVFYVDQSIMAGMAEPSRIFVYDMNNKLILAPGIIEKDATKRGLKYKVNITDYIRGLLINDNINVKLGVSVAQGTSNIKFKKIKEAPSYAVWSNPQFTAVQKNAYFFPEASVMNPLGTVLYGSSSSVPEEKRLKLEIYYTKPN